MAVTSRTFKSGNSDAVRLPKEISFGPGVEVEIERKGDVGDDFTQASIGARDAGEAAEPAEPSRVGVRHEIEIPERSGL